MDSEPPPHIPSTPTLNLRNFSPIRAVANVPISGRPKPIKILSFTPNPSSTVPSPFLPHDVNRNSHGSASKHGLSSPDLFNSSMFRTPPRHTHINQPGTPLVSRASSVLGSITSFSITHADENTPPPTTSRPPARKRKERSNTVTSPSALISQLAQQQAHREKRQKLSQLSLKERARLVLDLMAELAVTFIEVKLQGSPADVTCEEKLGVVRDLISELGMSWSEVQQRMYEPPPAQEYASWNDSDHVRHRSRAGVVSRFLQGRNPWTVSRVLRLWIRHPYGKAHRTSLDMFSPKETRAFIDIGPVRPAMTSFAVQIVAEHLASAAEKAVHPSAGLHVHIPSKRHPEKKHIESIDWVNLGSNTLSTVSRIHQQRQPLLRYLLSRVASRHQHLLPITSPVEQLEANAESSVPMDINNESPRVYRPLDIVVDDMISKALFSRSKYARLPAFLTGLFHFASNTSIDAFRYESRVGNSVAYSTILRALYGLSRRAADYTVNRCKDLTSVMWVVCDNVQHYHRRRKARLDLENTMNIGMAGTAFFKPLRHANALDYEDKAKRRAASRRDQMTTDTLLRHIDTEHEQRVYPPHWQWVLGEYVPECAASKAHALMKLRTRGKIFKIDDTPTEACPLASTSGRETDIGEFLPSVLDLMGSTGQTKARFIPRLFPFGGDGLTFELLLKLVQQRQFHTSAFTSFRILNPLLLWWHGLWTNLSRLIDKHLVSYSSLDPSTLGHSASKINRTIRVDQGKFDFHQGSELVYFVLDMRMLDCWRLILLREAATFNVDVPVAADVFEVARCLSAAKKLPELEDIEKLSDELHRTYSTEACIYRSANGLMPIQTVFPPRNITSTPTDSVSPPTSQSILAELDKLADTPLPVPAESIPAPKFLAPDGRLSRCQDFIREAIRSREAAWASAEGDVGRVWAQMKVMMFSFAGSSHKKYAQYLLETLFDLELESSPELRDTLLDISHVNLSGLPGKQKPCDLVQEYFNRIFEAIVQHKGKDYGDRFIRDAISRNLHHFQRLKTEFLDGVALAPRSSRHTNPHSKPEVRVLLREYREQDLHCYVPGRGEQSVPLVTHFKLGCQALRGGLLKKWTTKMMFMRGAGGAHDLEEDNEDTVDLDMSRASLCAMDMVDGRLESRVLQPEQDAMHFIQAMELPEHDHDSDDSDDESDRAMGVPDFETDDEDFPELP